MEGANKMPQKKPQAEAEPVQIPNHVDTAQNLFFLLLLLCASFAVLSNFIPSTDPLAFFGRADESH